MSYRDFISQTTDAEWAAFCAGRDRAQRDQWMRTAETFQRDGNRTAMQICVQTARACNREYLKDVAKYRAAKVPQRKRA
jgi:hypothetical protein